MLKNNHNTRSTKYSETEILQVPSAPRLRPQPAPSHFMELNLGKNEPQYDHNKMS